MSTEQELTLKYTSMITKAARYVFNRSNRSVPVEDLVQIGYIGMLRAVRTPHTAGNDNIDGYVYLSARGEMQNFLKLDSKKYPQYGTIENELVHFVEEDKVEHIHKERRLNWLYKELDTLKPSQRGILRMHIREELGFVEISKRLNSSSAQVNHVVRAVTAKLKEKAQ